MVENSCCAGIWGCQRRDPAPPGLTFGRQTQKCGPSLLSNELFRRSHCLSAKIIMPRSGDAHEAFRRLDQVIELLAECDGDNSVVLAVHHEHRPATSDGCPRRARYQASIFACNSSCRGASRTVSAEIPQNSRGGQVQAD